MKKSDWLYGVGIVLAIAICWYIGYGISTQCPGSSIWKGNYINCSETNK